jgi:hypothetical protein
MIGTATALVGFAAAGTMRARSSMNLARVSHEPTCRSTVRLRSRSPALVAGGRAAILVYQRQMGGHRANGPAPAQEG